MYQSIWWSRQAVKSKKGNHRRKLRTGIESVWGYTGIPITLLR